MLFWLYILTLNGLFEWIRLSDPPLSLWEFSPQLSLSFGRSYRVRYATGVCGALLYVLTGELENADALEISRIFLTLSSGRRGRGSAVNHPPSPFEPLKGAGNKTEGEEISRLFGKSKVIKTDSRLYLSSHLLKTFKSGLQKKNSLY